jgi:hypothetical protein
VVPPAVRRQPDVLESGGPAAGRGLSGHARSHRGTPAHSRTPVSRRQRPAGPLTEAYGIAGERYRRWLTPQG